MIRQRFLLALLLAGGGLILGVVLSAPWARSAAAPWAPTLYELFDRVCHQNPERSFHLFGEPLAVCHRCFGLYLGGWLGLALAPLASGLERLFERRPRLLLLFAAPLVIDVLAPGDHAAIRFATGLLAALPIGVLLYVAVRQIAAGPRHTVHEPPLGADRSAEGRP